MLKSARCAKCNATLRLTPRLAEVKLPPRTVECPSCKVTIDTTPLFRVTWMEALLWRLLFVVSLPLTAWLVWARGGEGGALLTYAAIRVPLLVGLAPFALSRMIAFPLQGIVDRLSKPKAS